LWKEYIPIFIVAFILLSGIANAPETHVSSMKHLSPTIDEVCSYQPKIVSKQICGIDCLDWSTYENGTVYCSGGYGNVCRWNNVTCNEKICDRTLYSYPKNYWNGSAYEPINTTIYEVNRNYYGYSFTYGNEHGLYDTYFYDSSPISVFKKGNYALIQTPYAVGWYDTSSEDYGILENVLLSSPILNDNIVTYPDIFYGMNATYEYQNDKLKETIVISEDTKNYITTHYPNIPSPETKWFIVANKLDFVNINMADKGVKIVNPKTVVGKLEFRDSLTEDLKFFLPLSWAWDSNKNESCDENSTGCFDVKWRIIKYGDDWYVLYGVPLTWFTDKQFPIYIDPTVILRTDDTEVLDDTWVDEENPNKNWDYSNTGSYTNGEYLMMDDDVNSRKYSYIKYNISFMRTITPNIINAELSMREGHGGGSDDFYIYHVYNQTWTEESITWNDQPCGSEFDNSAECNLTEEDKILNDYSG